MRGRQARPPGTTTNEDNMSKQDTYYSICYGSLDIDCWLSLTAKTYLGARRQARKIAKENGLRGYTLHFHRVSDGCRGQIDA